MDRNNKIILYEQHYEKLLPATYIKELKMKKESVNLAPHNEKKKKLKFLNPMTM